MWAKIEQLWAGISHSWAGSVGSGNVWLRSITSGLGEVRSDLDWIGRAPGCCGGDEGHAARVRAACTASVYATPAGRDNAAEAGRATARLPPRVAASREGPPGVLPAAGPGLHVAGTHSQGARSAPGAAALAAAARLERRPCIPPNPSLLPPPLRFAWGLLGRRGGGC